MVRRVRSKDKQEICLRLTDSGRAVVAVDERLLDADSFSCSFGEETADMFVSSGVVSGASLFQISSEVVVSILGVKVSRSGVDTAVLSFNARRSLAKIS